MKKHIAAVALMLGVGAVAVYGQGRTVKMTFSGTVGASSVNLQQPNAPTVEENFSGHSSLGQFTFRNVSSETGTPQASSTCSGATLLSFTRGAGGGVFRFQDGSLLTVSLTKGEDCVDLVAQQGNCTMTFRILGGSGRFKGASGTLTLTEVVVPVVGDAGNNPVFFASTGEVTGTVSGINSDREHAEGQ